MMNRSSCWWWPCCSKINVTSHCSIEIYSSLFCLSKWISQQPNWVTHYHVTTKKINLFKLTISKFYKKGRQCFFERVNINSRQKVNFAWVAAIAPRFRLRLPSAAPGSNPNHPIHTFFNWYCWNCKWNEKMTKMKRKRGRDWPLFKKG